MKQYLLSVITPQGDPPPPEILDSIMRNVQAVRQVLELDEFDLPVALLLGNYGLQGYSGVAMPSSTIVEDDVNLLH